MFMYLVPFAYVRDKSKMNTSLESLAKEVLHACSSPDEIKISPVKPSSGAGAITPKPIALEKKPGRAFKHVLTGKYLAESGKT